MKIKYTGEETQYRRERQEKRLSHIQSLHDNTVADELPAAELPEVFIGIQEVS